MLSAPLPLCAFVIGPILNNLGKYNFIKITELI